MEYEVFMTEVLRRQTERLGIEADDLAHIRFYKDGFSGETPEERRFVERTNDFYGHSGEMRLVGDYFTLMYDIPGAGGRGARFSVQELYDKFRSGGWDAVDAVVDENLRYSKGVNHNALNAVNDYAQTKDSLILCLRNTALTKVRYRDSVFQKMDDMAMILYLIVNDDGKGNRLIAPVRRQSAEAWGMEDDDILAAALENTARLSPPRLYTNVLDVISPPSDRTIGEFMSPLSPQRPIPRNQLGALLTAIPQTDGAVALFYPGVQERISRLAGGDYYVVFTAKDEAHIYPAGVVNLKTMRDALQDANRAFPADMLTNNIYFYDAGRKSLRKA